MHPDLRLHSGGESPFPRCRPGLVRGGAHKEDAGGFWIADDHGEGLVAAYADVGAVGVVPAGGVDVWEGEQEGASLDVGYRETNLISGADLVVSLSVGERHVVGHDAEDQLGSCGERGEEGALVFVAWAVSNLLDGLGERPGLRTLICTAVGVHGQPAKLRAWLRNQAPSTSWQTAFRVPFLDL
jgi:hypothetical protein